MPHKGSNMCWNCFRWVPENDITLDKVIPGRPVPLCLACWDKRERKVMGYEIDNEVKLLS